MRTVRTINDEIHNCVKIISGLPREPTTVEETVKLATYTGMLMALEWVLENG